MSVAGILMSDSVLTHSTDLHVIGAGPAGSIAALSAIRYRNAHVLISEEHSTAGLPVHCSGLFSVSGLESLSEFADYKKTIINNVQGAIIDFAGAQLTVNAKKNIAHVCARTAFDKILATNAEQEGAKILYGEKINSDNFKSKNIIGADGPNSFVASYFGFPRIYKFVSTLQANIKYATETPEMVELFFSNSRFPGFFGWVIPHNEEEAEFGCGVALPNNAADAFNELLRLKGIRKKPKTSGAVIPIEVRSKNALTVDDRNILLVGDAAGHTKATTGGGVILGGNCAKLAGRHYDDPFTYEVNWRLSLDLDFFMHSLIRDYLANKSDEQMRWFGEKLKAVELGEFLSKNGHMDKPSKMLSFELLGMLTRLL